MYVLIRLDLENVQLYLLLKIYFVIARGTCYLGFQRYNKVGLNIKCFG